MEASELWYLTLKAGIKRLREAGILEWIYYLRPEDPADECVPQREPEVTLLSKAIIKMLVIGTLVSEILKSLLCKPELMVGKADSLFFFF